ncbi:MAG: hypothetical protein HZB95_07835 [Nitrosomonadales bacterium]|nr:hypothetical protein [Nitrosomonadales bacterium]
MATSLSKLTVLVALAISCAASQAEVLPDPTRPAAEFLVPGSAGGDAKAAPTDEGLRTIIISSDRRSAVINGQQVPLGGKLGEERLMAVCEDSVVLQGANGRREISLYPDVVIQGRKNRRCNTPEARQSAAVPAKKLKKIGHATKAVAARKKERSCK